MVAYADRSTELAKAGKGGFYGGLLVDVAAEMLSAAEEVVSQRRNLVRKVRAVLDTYALAMEASAAADATESP
jgi:hypothetical protein